MVEAIRLIKQLVSEKFWGKLTLSFENGRISLGRIEKTVKFDE